MRPPYYYHPRMLAYDFGPQHPFRPERLARCTELLSRFGVEPVDPGVASLDDALRVHSAEYLNLVRRLDERIRGSELEVSREEYDALTSAGFLSGDNPPFPGMWEASLCFTAGTVRAAFDVAGGAPRALTLGAGLHHAQREKASGFCILNDPAIACSILLERFERVVYIDIDLHHGDGVQWIWYDDPRVLTISIHESGRTLYPGTGFTHETGANFSSLNIPLAAGTTGEVWLDAFRRIVPRAVEQFDPGAVVLQIGSDPHFSDPLGHLNVSAQEWLDAVRIVDGFGLPLVACGGGGYNMNSAVRMWSAAILVLSGIEFGDSVPEDLAQAWDMPTFFDSMLPGPSGSGQAEAAQVVEWFESSFLPGLGSG